MLTRTKYYLRLIRKAIRHRKILIAQLDFFLQDHFHQIQFTKLFGYWPAGLEYTDLNILRLSPTSRIGRENRLILSKTIFPCGENESLISLGKNCWTGKNVELNILAGTQIIIKNYTTIQDYCKIIGNVTIEKYCLLAPSVFISSGNHYAKRDEPDIIRNQDEYHLTNKDLLSKHSKRVHVDEDCWLGFSSFVKPGVYIGRGSIIGANAVITKDVLPYTIVGGTSKLISCRYDFSPPVKIQASNPSHKPYFYRGFFHKNGEYKSIDAEHIILGPEGGVIVLQKGTLEYICISGKLLNDNAEQEIVLSVSYNGHLLFSSKVEINSLRCFNIKITKSEFQPSSVYQNDYLLRLMDNLNIFHISCNHRSRSEPKDESPLVAFSHFEEKII